MVYSPDSADSLGSDSADSLDSDSPESIDSVVESIDSLDSDSLDSPESHYSIALFMLDVFLWYFEITTLYFKFIGVR